MRIGFVICGSPLIFNGATYFSKASILNMLNHISAFCDVEILCPVEYKSAPSEGHAIEASHIKFHPIDHWRDGRDLYFGKMHMIGAQIADVIRAHREVWDAIWIVDPEPLSQIAYGLAKSYGIPTILYLRGDDIFEVRHRNPQGLRRVLAMIWCSWLKFSIPHMLRHSIGIVTGKALYEKYKSQAPRLIRFYSTSVPMKDARARASQRRESVSSGLRLITVGNLVRYKRVDIAIRAVKSARDAGLPITLDIVGAGSEGASLKRLAEDLHIAQFVNFSGFIPYGDELFRHYAQANVFVLPSETEGTPKVIPEALSFGLPVLATAVGGVPDILKHGQNGFLLSSYTLDDLVLTLSRMVSSPPLLETLQTGAFASAMEYTTENQFGHLVKTLKEMLRV